MITFNLIKTFHVDTGSFISSSGCFYYKKSDKILKINRDLSITKLYESQKNYGLAKVEGEIVYAVNGTSIIVVRDTEANEIPLIQNVRKQVKAVSEEGHILMRMNVAEEGWKLYLLNNLGIVCWDLDNSEHCLAFFNKEGIFVHWLNLRSISLFESNSFVERWQIDFGANHRQIQFIEVHDGLLVVNLGSGYLGAYNIIDGTLVWERMMESAEPHLKIAGGHIYFLYPCSLGNRFAVYSLGSGAVLYEQPLMDAVIQREFKFTKPFITDEYFIITGQYRQHIFFFNRQTAMLDLSVDLNPYTKAGFGYDNAPELHGNYLYQLDGDGQLLVFEK